MAWGTDKNNCNTIESADVCISLRLLALVDDLNNRIIKLPPVNYDVRIPWTSS